MNLLNPNLVLLVLGALLVAAAMTAAWRPGPRALGAAWGVGLTAAGIAMLWSRPEGSPLQLDAVSLPRMLIVGLAATAIFAVMPRRHASARSTASIVLMMTAHLAVVLLPWGLPAGLMWAVACGLSWLTLPRGAVRNVALPYLAISAAAGLAGFAVDGLPGHSLLLLAAAVRMGLFPFHSWVITAYERGPMTGAVAVVAPMSGIALVARAPLGLEGHGALVVALALAALLSAGLALAQTSLGRAVGLLTVSVEAVVILGVLDTDSVGHLGGLLMWGATGLSLVGLGLCTAAMTSRSGSLSVKDYSGLIDRAPALGGLFLLFGLASVGAPGTADFVSGDLVLHGALAHHPALLLLFVSAISAQGYVVLQLFFRVFFGPARSMPFADALPRERAALIGLAALLLIAGLAPQLLVDGWLPTGGDDTASIGSPYLHQP